MELAAQAPQQGMVLCADCGVPILPSSANLCLSCLRNSVDITEGIPKQAAINFCRNCERYLNPPQTWVPAKLESRELLAICLKKLKGLNKVRLIDAGFIWTEPHSKRLRVKLTVQKEVLTSTILQQVFEIEFVVQYGQCPDCTRMAAKNTWKAMVQVRQKVPHKRTFLYLEQLILKHNAHRDTVSIQEKKDGLDFYYSQRAHAVKMCEFLASVVPVRTQASSAVVSMDIHTSTVNNKFSYSVEIAPICKDDLVCLPKSLARSMSQMPQLVLCQRISNTLKFIDPASLQVADLAAEKYWREPVSSLCAIPELVEFLVLDIEPTGVTNGKWVAADAQVSPLNATSFGQADAVYHTRTHLGGLLQPGDTAMGYNLRSANFNDALWDTLNHDQTPDVVLVRKSYPDSKKRRRGRNWKLRSIAKEAGDDSGEGTGRGALGRKGGLDGKKVERDYEMFLRELEEDEEMRSGVNLYRDPEAEERAKRRREAKALHRARKLNSNDGDADGGMEVEDAADAAVEVRGAAALDGAMTDDDGFTTDGESEWGDDDDIPKIRDDELLAEELEGMQLDE
ncbi:putative NMD3-nonsense-mediated mRNA decay protein [Ceraceosorus guamensis]|uniref:60S ribosomal export protein NMD3 n=1 Tax=Ceraceosorus guamensis TaxID=1522189 RepID=A0A316W1B2_9BASI|nr:putative NMD3-nonsense-mediated mRNA decay protein [Ceraceosorus guamensis]PWN42351.1 putative NMD3-nonsense-mediated mRNA decay protein [Ceraceosorus guamensis]